MIKIYGASDDLIEVEGNINEEFGVDGGELFAFSDGTVLRVAYSQAGVWRVSPVARGSAVLTITQAPEDDDRDYTDRATLDGTILWVVQGGAIGKMSGRT
jgi:hypothetical protein